MTGHGEKLTRKQEDAIAALLDAPTVAAAAGKAGIGERTDLLDASGGREHPVGAVLVGMADGLCSLGDRVVRCRCEAAGPASVAEVAHRG